MESDNTHTKIRNDEDFEKILITEWPVVNAAHATTQNLSEIDFLGKRKRKTFEPVDEEHCERPDNDNLLKSYKEDRNVPHDTDSCSDDKIGKECDVKKAGTKAAVEPVKESLVSVRVARWWRREKQRISRDSLSLSVSSSKNANTTLFHIVKLPECRQYLEEERMRLKRNQQSRADVYAAVASIEDWLGKYELALETIVKAVALDPDHEYLWLKEKLVRQCKAVKVQNSFQIQSSCLVFPQFEEVERVSVTALSALAFRDKYIRQKKPVILLDVVDHMTPSPWSLDHIKLVAGSVKAAIKHSVPDSVEWARLEESRETTVGEFIDAVQKGETNNYLFDWSLPLHCPELAAEISLPEYFSGNYLQATSPGSLYRDSWPSLFVAPAGVASDLHVDAFASSFWMALFEGQKRWTFFDEADAPLLYPQYFHSLDPVFNVDLRNVDLEKFPLMASTKPKRCVLKSGELLYVPAGSPHFVENLSPSLAVSSNYVDDSNIKRVCEELRVSGLLDPRASDLLKQFESQDFVNARTLPENTVSS